MRSVWLAVLNDGTDEIHNMHSLEVKLDPKQSAYDSLRAVMVEDYGEEAYPVDDDDTNGYLFLPTKVSKSVDGRYLSRENRLNCDGEPFYKVDEVIEDPVSRNFMVFFVDPEDPFRVPCPRCKGTKKHRDDTDYAKEVACTICNDTGMRCPLGENSLLDTLSAIPDVEQQFLPMSDVLLLLDAIRTVAVD